MKNMNRLKFIYALFAAQWILLVASTAAYAENKMIDHFDLGIIYLSDQKYEDAFTNLDSAIESRPNCSKCYFARGYALEKLGKTSEALKDYNKAIKLNPKDANVYFYRGMLCMVQPSDRNQAIADFTRCLQMDPINRHRYYRARGTAHSLNSQPGKALLDYDKVMEIGDKDSSLLYNMGGCYLDLDQYEEALDSLTEAVKIDKNNDLALLSIAKIYSHQNQKADALKYLELAVQKNGHVSQYGITKTDHRWNTIRDTKQFQSVKNADAKK